jgi:N-acetylneuraminate epimerase
MKMPRIGTAARRSLTLALAALANALPGTPASMPGLSWEWRTLAPLPDPEGFSGGVAGVSGGALLFGGGSNFIGKRPWEGGTKLWYDTVYALPSPHARWVLAGKLPRPSAYGVGATFKGELVCAGGGSGREHYTEVFALAWDGRTLQRRPLAPLPRPCSFASGAVVGHTLFVAGGLDRPDAVTAMRNLWALDLDHLSSAWRVLEPIPGVGRMEPEVGASGDSFYVFGGIEVQPSGAEKPNWTYLADAYVYAPGKGWRRIADLPRADAGGPSPTPVTPDGKLLLVTGDDGTRRKLDGPNHPGFPRDGFLYDPGADRWTAVEEGPISRGDVPTAVWHGLWIIPGGERKPGYRSNEVWGLRLARP